MSNFGALFGQCLGDGQHCAKLDPPSSCHGVTCIYVEILTQSILRVIMILGQGTLVMRWDVVSV